MGKIAFCLKLRMEVSDVKPSECRSSCATCGEFRRLSKAEITEILREWTNKPLNAPS